jgi:hypothetical protein
VPNFNNRIPQGSGSRGTVGAYLSESLPNITGTFGVPKYEIVNVGTGAFTSTVNGTEYNMSSLEVNRNGHFFYFSASRSSSTYQDNAPVQQAATVVNFCIRY